MRAIVDPHGRLLTAAGMVFRVALGRGGVRADKQEGDGATPVGLMPLRRVMYRADRIRAPDCAVPTEPIAPEDAWCDESDRPEYNRMIRLPYDGHYEELWRQDGLYDLIGVLGWNDSPVQRRRGSAIFLHVARSGYAPTDGCIALGLDDLRQLLARGLTEVLVLSGSS